jgi:hypothetical protein
MRAWRTVGIGHSLDSSLEDDTTAVVIGSHELGEHTIEKARQLWLEGPKICILQMTYL